MSSRRLGGRPRILSLRRKGMPPKSVIGLLQRRAGPVDNIRRTVTVFSWSALLVGCSRSELRLFFLGGTLNKEVPKCLAGVTQR